MAEQLTKVYVPQDLKTDFALQNEWAIYRQQSFLQRNLLSSFRYHACSLKTAGRPKNLPGPYVEIVKVEDLTADIDANSDQDRGDGTAATPQIDAVSKDSLLYKNMDPDFETNPRRSIRRWKIFDDDEAILTLAPVSIRKKVNFKSNRPPEEDRPKKRYKADRSIVKVKCHCSLSIWDNRNGAELIQTHNNCMLYWDPREGQSTVVDIDMDKPFIIRSGALKVPTERNGEWTLGISTEYQVELKLWPSSKDSVWPPIPVLGPSDGDVYRPNKGAHTVNAKSLLAKFKQLADAPEPDTAYSIYYLPEGEKIRRSKFGLELAAEWTRSTNVITPETTPQTLDWAIDDEGSLFGRKRKRPARYSSPVASPQPRKKPRTPQKPRNQEPTIEYFWEPTPALKHLAQDRFQITEHKGLGCLACPQYAAEDLLELRFHFLSTHSKWNFNLDSSSYDEEKGTLLSATFRIRSTVPSQRRLEGPEPFTFLSPAGAFDLKAYINGDRSWSGESSVSMKTASRKRDRVVNATTSLSTRPKQRIPGFVNDDFVAAREKNNGHLPPELVPDFRKPDRPRLKIAKLVRHTDNNTLSYDSISNRPTLPSEDPLSETDDERDGEWFIQRHLEDLDVDGENYGRPEARQELFRKWDRHRLEEKLDHIVFLSESLVRFVRKHRKWLRQDTAQIQSSWARLLGNLREDKLISPEFHDTIHRLVYEENDDDAAEAAAAQLNGEVRMVNGDVAAGEGDAISDPEEEPDETPDTNTSVSSSSHLPEDPVLAVEAIRQRLRRTRLGCCGDCSKPISEREHRMAVRCTVRECANAEVLYHPACVKVRAQTPDTMRWTCLPCRVTAKLSKESAAKGKGKERAM